MTKRRSVFATALTVTAITVASGGFGPTGSVIAQGNSEVIRSTTTRVPATLSANMGGTRTKNAALPTTTTKPNATAKSKAKPSKKKTGATTVAPSGK